MAEVVGVARVERKFERERCRSDEKVDGSRSSRLAPGRGHGGVDATVGSRRVCIEGQRIECRLGPLEPVLAAGTFAGIAHGMRPSSELGHADGGHGDLGWQGGGIDGL